MLSALFVDVDGGVGYGSEEHQEQMARMKEVGRRLAAATSEGGGATDGAPPKHSQEAMAAELGIALVAFMAAFGVENLTAYSGAMTAEGAAQAREHWAEAATHAKKAEEAAPDEATTMLMRGHHAYATLACPRQHAFASFSPTNEFGATGEVLRETIDRYDFEVVHDVSRSIGVNIDFFAFGLEPVALLLFFGDVAGAKAGCEKVRTMHERMLERVKQGDATAESYSLEAINACWWHPAALLLLGDSSLMRSFYSTNLIGAAIDDKAIRDGLATFYSGPFGWATPEGYCHSTLASWITMVKSPMALYAASDASDAESDAAAIKAWLPSAAELLKTADAELGARVQRGVMHPSLICARVHGEKLGDWAATAEVASGVLELEAFNPFLRVEALLLLGKARAALGETSRACEAAEACAKEAAGAKYSWYEMLAMRDLVRYHGTIWCAPMAPGASLAAKAEAKGAVENARVRLREVVSRLVATPEELTAVLGEGVL